jgi:hypothetical protein
MAEQHSHDAEVHDHQHAHVTHYLSSGQTWTHLTASHQHEHNHAALTTATSRMRTQPRNTAARPTCTTTSSRPARPGNQARSA